MIKTFEFVWEKCQKTAGGFFDLYCISDYKAKMLQIQFRPGLRPLPCWEAYSAPQTPSWIGRPTSKEEKGGEGMERKVWWGREGRKGKERGGKGEEGVTDYLQRTFENNLFSVAF